MPNERRSPCCKRAVTVFITLGIYRCRACGEEYDLDTDQQRQRPPTPTI